MVGNLMKFTLGQAAIKVGRNKSTLSRDIQKGTLSAEKQSNGSYLIDASELFRVYEKRIEDTNPQESIADATGNSNVAVDVEVLRMQLKMVLQSNEDKELQLQDKEKQIDDLRQDRDHWRQQATYLLEDKRNVTQENAPEKEVATVASKKWWKLW